MIDNYKEALKHFEDVDMLNGKGLKALVKLLDYDINELRQRIIHLEHELSYKGKDVPK